MKKLFKMAGLTAALATATNVAYATDTIGFADPNYLMQNHPVALDSAQKFEKFMKENQAKFEAEEKALVAERNKIESDGKKLQSEQTNLEASLKKKVAALEKEAPRLRSKDIQSRQQAIENEAKAFEAKANALQKRQAEFAKKAEAFQNRVNKAQQEAGGLDPVAAQKQVVEEINATIKEVATAKGYTLVFPPSIALFAADEKKDITEAVLDALKAKHPEIKLDETTSKAEKANPEKSDDAKAAEVKPEEAKK